MRAASNQPGNRVNILISIALNAGIKLDIGFSFPFECAFPFHSHFTLVAIFGFPVELHFAVCLMCLLLKESALSTSMFNWLQRLSVSAKIEFRTKKVWKRHQSVPFQVKYNKLLVRYLNQSALLPLSVCVFGVFCCVIDFRRLYFFRFLCSVFVTICSISNFICLPNFICSICIQSIYPPESKMFNIFVFNLQWADLCECHLAFIKLLLFSDRTCACVCVCSRSVSSYVRSVHVAQLLSTFLFPFFNFFRAIAALSYIYSFNGFHSSSVFLFLLPFPKRGRLSLSFFSNSFSLIPEVPTSCEFFLYPRIFFLHPF